MPPLCHWPPSILASWIVSPDPPGLLPCILRARHGPRGRDAVGPRPDSFVLEPGASSPFEGSRIGEMAFEEPRCRSTFVIPTVVVSLARSCGVASDSVWIARKRPLAAELRLMEC